MGVGGLVLHLSLSCLCSPVPGQPPAPVAGPPPDPRVSKAGFRIPSNQAHYAHQGMRASPELRRVSPGRVAAGGSGNLPRRGVDRATRSVHLSRADPAGAEADVRTSPVGQGLLVELRPPGGG